MTQILVFGVMLFFAMAPFVVLTMLMRSGQSGLALTIIAVIIGTGAVFFYASAGTFGVEPIFAMAVFAVVCVPAFLGSTAGAFLGHLLRKQDDRKANS